MQVEQIDREAAVEYWNGLADEWNSWTEISGQEQDATVQAFARHRQQARAEVVGEIVAWMKDKASYAWSRDSELADQIEAKFGTPNVAD